MRFDDYLRRVCSIDLCGRSTSLYPALNVFLVDPVTSASCYNIKYQIPVTHWYFLLPFSICLTPIPYDNCEWNWWALSLVYRELLHDPPKFVLNSWWGPFDVSQCALIAGRVQQQ
jgi:hypothetical protein